MSLYADEMRVIWRVNEPTRKRLAAAVLANDGVEGLARSILADEIDLESLTGLDLTGINLRGAFLVGANLWESVLKRAVLVGAVLREADLRRADLRGTNLTGAVLCGAKLGNNQHQAQGAIFGLDISHGDGSGQNTQLVRADLRGANLAGVEAHLLHQKALAGALFNTVEVDGWEPTVLPNVNNWQPATPAKSWTVADALAVGMILKQPA